MIVVAGTKESTAALKEGRVVAFEGFCLLQQVYIAFGSNIKSVLFLANQSTSMKAYFFVSFRALKQVLCLIKFINFSNCFT